MIMLSIYADGYSLRLLESKIWERKQTILNWLGKLLLTSTAIAPVLFTYALSLYLSERWMFALLLTILGITLFIACIFFINYAKANLERINFSARTVEAADRENMVFLVLYLLPLFTGQFTAPDWPVWIVAVVIFAVVVGTGYNYHFNPMLGIMGWHFYKASTEEGITYVLITKKQLRTSSKRLEVGQLTEYIVLDLGEK